MPLAKQHLPPLVYPEGQMWLTHQRATSHAVCPGEKVFMAFDIQTNPGDE
jgi:hypothetical protein